MKLQLNQFVERVSDVLAEYAEQLPWEITENIAAIIYKMIESCGDDYEVSNGIAVHQTATVEKNVVLKPPVLIAENVTVGANAYLRGGVLLDKNVHVGAGCEIKQSVIFNGTAIAHFNYIGNSIIGSNINFEAGAVAANHFNERENKFIAVLAGGGVIDTGVKKFGSLVGDDSRIGANAVLSPGTILEKRTVVKRLELIEQLPEKAHAADRR